MTSMFITFEGLDYSGKTTQVQLLVDRLQKLGLNIVLLREPGGTTISEKIRTILLDKQHDEMSGKTEMLLFSAARAQLIAQVIRPALEQGSTVICDRFYDSTTAYQGYGRGINLREIQSLNTIATDGTTPDLTVFMNVPIDEIVRRANTARPSTDRMEDSGRLFFERVHQGYLALAREHPQRFVLVDGTQPIQEIHETLWNIIQQRLKV